MQEEHAVYSKAVASLRSSERVVSRLDGIWVRLSSIPVKGALRVAHTPAEDRTSQQVHRRPAIADDIQRMGDGAAILIGAFATVLTHWLSFLT